VRGSAPADRLTMSRRMVSHFDNIFVTLTTGQDVTGSVEESCANFNPIRSMR